MHSSTAYITVIMFVELYKLGRNKGTRRVEVHSGAHLLKIRTVQNDAPVIASIGAGPTIKIDQINCINYMFNFTIVPILLE